MIPSGYKLVATLWSAYNSSSSTNAYFDSGVYPSDKLNVEGNFDFRGSVGTMYFLAARNTSSTSSVGQLGFGANSSGYPFIAYYNAQTNVYSTPSMGGYYSKDGEDLSYYNAEYCGGVTGSGTSFTGNKTMYILARNNAGSVQFGSAIGSLGFDYLKITDSSNPANSRKYIPVFNESTSTYGLYDLEHNNFITKTGGTNNYDTYVSFGVSSNGHGKAYILDERVGEINEILVSTSRSPQIRIVAEPDDGYAFDYWEKNGSIVSRERDFYYSGEQTNLVAHFIKITSVQQNNGFRAMTLGYGATAEGNTDQKTNAFALVRSASIKEDIMAKSTSTIVLDSVPSGITVNCPIIVFDSMNKQMFIGLVKSIDDKTLTVREPLSIIDGEFLITTGLDPIFTITNFTSRVVYYYIMGIMNISGLDTNPAIKKYASDFQVGYDKIVHSDGSLNYSVAAPTIEDNSIVNAEDYVLELANQFMIYFEPSYVQDRENYDGHVNQTGQAILLFATNPYIKQKMTFGNNSEEITNISIQVEEAENTVLEVYSSTGSFRGVWGMKDDGTIGKMVFTNQFPADVHGFVANTNCKAKIVMSDDSIAMLKKQYLSNSFFNHKITFDVDLSKGTFRFDDFELCRPVDFYYGDKLYKSIITAREYSIDPNTSKVRTMRVTLGKVRNKLTTKLNMRKK